MYPNRNRPRAQSTSVRLGNLFMSQYPPQQAEWQMFATIDDRYFDEMASLIQGIPDRRVRLKVTKWPDREDPVATLAPIESSDRPAPRRQAAPRPAGPARGHERPRTRPTPPPRRPIEDAPEPEIDDMEPTETTDDWEK